MSAPATTPADPWLQVPLEGVQLVEASAGTGKTYTLATLVARLVVERGLRVGQVLAVTFTEAATQELRKRIRERLQLALDLVDAPPADGEKPDVALTRQLLQAHRQRSGETDAALRARLRQAVLETDLAAIFTIHGFCARVLREHALESGQGFDPPELLGNDRALRHALAADLWRAHAADATAADDLAALWKEGPDALADDLRALLGDIGLLPPDAPLPPDPAPRLHAAGQALAEGFRAHGDDFLAALLAAVEAKVLNGNSYRADWIRLLWTQLSAWCEAGDYAAPLDERIGRLTAGALQAKTNKTHAGRTPDSPLCVLVPPYMDALQAQVEWVARRRIALLHRVRADARARLAVLKRQQRVQTYDDLIDGVADALDGAQGPALAAALRAQYRIALVDEFQDTDARQWRIFDRVFGSGSEAMAGQPPALFLIGDPKQAIYGFRGGDVHTYLAAGEVAAAAPPLSHNFRSRPSVLRAIDALYAQAGGAAFVDPRIAFHRVAPGGTRGDADFQRGGTDAPALTLWQAPPPPPDPKTGKPRPHSAEDSRALATRACVAAIHAVLSEGQAGTATLRDGEPVRPVRAGDIAVLVRSHAEASRIQQALAAAGIPAVAAGKQSLFATSEARELHALLLALLHGADDGRLRAALSTVLVGVDATGIDALEHDGGSHRHWQQQAVAWRERLRRGGPLALVGELCAARSEALLGLVDGERRVSNFLQLAELLQEAQARALGLHGLVDWLGRRIADADPDDEAQLLRLESDARRVQIVTLHKSKGLEYPLVFLPFAGIAGKAPAPGRHCSVHDPAHGRCLHWRSDLAEARWGAAEAAWKDEQRAEDARLLYVGLTRAVHALWIATGAFVGHDRTALAPMLRDLAVLAADPAVRLEAGLPLAPLPRLPPESAAAVPAPREVSRVLAHDWWVYSFTQLANADAGHDGAPDALAAATLPVASGRDEPAATDAAMATAAPGETIEAAFDPRFSGNRFGVALHAALEHCDFAAWRGWREGEPVPAGEAAPIAEALRAGGYGADELDDGIVLATRLIGHTLTVALPEGVRLCEVPAGERRPEIEFQFALQPTRVDALLRLLHAHGVVRERAGFGLRTRLEGLMTGLVDLTYRHAGRWYVLDYKSNRLPAYDHASLEAAMAHSEYDLQALIYTLALHRWLRFRLGDAYDYARDFGGIRYLFCRGLDAGRHDGHGIHAQRFAPELVNALDALFGRPMQEAAA
ncbi:UvrD-helicase domain-containing protein [Pseudoxanthomonas sp. 10H]|uniref:UvrD-helicase domain-containing protein n=1 Tax=Pseudoxanthomonas sp. 10H TaxID=3242729 RepID=UPI003558E55B